MGDILQDALQMLYINKVREKVSTDGQHPKGIPHREKEMERARAVGEAVSWTWLNWLGAGGLHVEHVPALEWVEASQNPSWQSW